MGDLEELVLRTESKVFMKSGLGESKVVDSSRMEIESDFESSMICHRGERKKYISIYKLK